MTFKSPGPTSTSGRNAIGKLPSFLDAVVLSWPVASRADWIVSGFRSVPLHAETVWLMTLERQLEISKRPLVHEQMVRFRLLMCRMLTRVEPFPCLRSTTVV